LPAPRPGNPHQVVDAPRALPGVENTDAVTGTYDVIAFLRVESIAALGGLLTRAFHRMPGIIKTTTHVVVARHARHGPFEGDPGRQA
jgi:DNA-binding Lrp family transcriptional regulator